MKKSSWISVAVGGVAAADAGPGAAEVVDSKC